MVLHFDLDTSDPNPGNLQILQILVQTTNNSTPQNKPKYNPTSQPTFPPFRLSSQTGLYLLFVS